MAKKYSVSNNAQGQASIKDHLLCYSKSPEYQINLLARTEDAEARYSNRDNDPRGPWKAVDYLNQVDKEKRPNLCYDIKNPITGEIVRNKSKAWKFSFETHSKHVTEQRLWWGESGENAVPALKLYLSEARAGMTPHDWWPHGEVGHTDEAKKQLDTFRLDIPFETPKPVRLVSRVLQIASSQNSIVLDSFSGSGTTAHAVLEANKRDGGNRRFILVEMEDYADNLTAERIRRVINGYDFSGTQRTELMRERLNWRAISNAGDLVHKVEAIENLHGYEYDRIKKEVKDGELIVTGEKTVDERAEGLGGSFTYCTLGEPVELDRVLTGEALPSYEGLGAALFHMATSHPVNPADMRPADFYLGTARGQHVWLIYRPDLDWLKSPEAALTLARARQFAATAPDARHLAIAPARFVSQKMLAEENIPVDFVPLPFALYRIDRS